MNPCVNHIIIQQSAMQEHCIFRVKVYRLGLYCSVYLQAIEFNIIFAMYRHAKQNYIAERLETNCYRL